MATSSKPIDADVPARTTESLARFVVETRYEDLPAAVIHATRRLILDEIVVTAAAHGTPMARALLQLKGDQGGRPEATLIVDGRKVPVASAAYVHAQLANLLDADETMHNRMHTVSATVLPALAMAERTGASGKELIAAIATGYDITGRVGTSLRQYVPDGKGGLLFAPLFGWGWMSLGAAAAAGRLLGLDSAQLARAFGQAFVTTPVYFDVQKNNRRLLGDEHGASWHKYQMAGAMAEAGVNAAQLVSHGWMAQDDLFDEGSTFWQSFAAPGCDWEAMYGKLGERWFVTETSIKPYPFCRNGHATLDIFSRIVAEHRLGADDIEDVLMLIVPHELSEMLARTVHADESLKLMVSLPTAMALVALGVPPGPKWFNADFSSAPLRALAGKFRYEINPAWGEVLTEEMDRHGFYKRLPAAVTVRTRSGHEYTGASDYACGDPWSIDTSYDDDDVADKARQFLDGILPYKRIEALIAAVYALDEATDVSGITASMVR